MNRSGQPFPVKSAAAAPKDQSFVPAMPAAAAWSVIVTGMGVCAGGVGGGGLGAEPTPGADGSGGNAAGARVSGETGPLGQLACAMSELEPARPTSVSADPSWLSASPRTSSLYCVESGEVTVVHVVPSNCTASVWYRRRFAS